MHLNDASIFSNTNYIMSQRSFGQEISGNRQPNAELSSAQRAAIILKVEAGVLYKDIAAEF